ncbi:hypothetical protein GJAV_G00125490 [Gymnothorax javanicus]|nr:hypothetical protein GJAV_G00125490 [Gymnothorax javanicus]
MATFNNIAKESTLSKAEYLKRYLSGDGDAKKEKKSKKKRIKPVRKGMKIVDDDVHWEHLVNAEEKETQEEDEEEAPVVAEVIDERPEEVKRLEEFRNSQKWKRLGATNDDSKDSQELQGSYSTISSGNDSQMPTEQSSWQQRNDSPDASPPRKRSHNLSDASPQRRGQKGAPKRERPDSWSPSPLRRAHTGSRGPNKGSQDSSPSRRKWHAAGGSSRHGNDSVSDLSPPRNCARRSPDSDLSPPRKRPQRERGRGSDSDLSPPRRRPQQRGRGSDSDLSPPRRTTQTAPRMLSGGAAGLVSRDVLRKEQQENRRREKRNQPLEEESRNAQTVFRDKSGKRRDIDVEREELSRKAGEKAERDEKYAQWGRGLAQGQMQQQNVEDALREAEKPLARHAWMTRTWTVCCVSRRGKATPWLPCCARGRRRTPCAKGSKNGLATPALLRHRTGLTFRRATAGTEWTGRTGSSSGGTVVSRIKKPCRRRPTSGVWRTCRCRSEQNRMVPDQTGWASRQLRSSATPPAPAERNDGPLDRLCLTGARKTDAEKRIRSPVPFKEAFLGFISTSYRHLNNWLLFITFYVL